MKHIVLIIFSALFSLCSIARDPAIINAENSDRWSEKKANDWYANQQWPCGFNYIPANAISYTEMWMPYSFNPEIIDRELELAESTGFNCLRVVLPFVVWEHDPKAFRERLAAFLEICNQHGIKVMLTLFDDCAFGNDEKLKDPWYGKQPEVYVKDIVGTFRDGDRGMVSLKYGSMIYMRMITAFTRKMSQK